MHSGTQKKNTAKKFYYNYRINSFKDIFIVCNLGN